MRVSWPFRLPVPEYPTLLRFHSPLVEPDVRICRIRLSDKVSCVRVREKNGDRLIRLAFRRFQFDTSEASRLRAYGHSRFIMP
jgi:hypothetical protein